MELYEKINSTIGNVDDDESSDETFYNASIEYYAVWEVDFDEQILQKMIDNVVPKKWIESDDIDRDIEDILTKNNIHFTRKSPNDDGIILD